MSNPALALEIAEDGWKVDGSHNSRTSHDFSPAAQKTQELMPRIRPLK